MLRGKLIKVESNHSNLRNNEIEGKLTHIPEEGERFTLFARPLAVVEPGQLAMRVITTTEIETVDFDEGTRTFTFKTKNSTYKLEVDKELPLEEIFSYRSWRANA